GGAYHPPQITRVLARDGTILAELFTERRTVVPIATLPPHVKLAILAAEDARFYEHEGLNYLGMLRALIVNLRSGRTRQGASTITQQVVKNILLDPERSYQRKIREVILAKRVEQNLSKDEILELYLNHIYFGHGRYGIEEAARYYFGRPAAKLSLAEAALLAGLVASPEGYSPRKSPEKAARRRAFVLEQMHKKSFITDTQLRAALREPTALATTASAPPQLAPEVIEIVKRTLRESVGDGAALGGFTVTTTIDPKLQHAAREAVRDGLRSYDGRHQLRAPLKAPKGRVSKKGGRPSGVFEGTPRFEDYKVLVGEVTGADDQAGLLLVRVGTVRGAVRLEDHARYNPKNLPPSAFAEPGARVRVSLLAPPPAKPGDKQAPVTPLRLELGPQGALVAVDVRTREVLALVGNYEAVPGSLDRVTQAKRQPGSTFKPIVYSYALHTRRFTPASLVETRQGTVRGYVGSRAEDGDASAPVRLREALAKSINVSAVHVARAIGPANVVSWARALGITTPLGADLSLPLGAYEVPPLELVNVYAAFAAGGVYDAPRLITRIADATGREVALPPRPPSRRVMEEGEAFLTTSMLTSVIDHGTGSRAKSLGRPLAGKTGTTNEAKDAWFAGYSTDIACGVWIGYDDAAPLGGAESGASAALPTWIQFMRAAHAARPPTDFPRPPDVAVATIDPTSGLLARPEQADGMQEVFLQGTEPTEVAEPDAGADSAGEDGGAKGLEPGVEVLEVPRVSQDAATLPVLPPPDNPVPLF
ncbi:MAG: PBP1A family penicillin-binding protein, partial [Polyangiaceae bacterium]|nr:PBP1A family penicillin-binding protein [Polyangiaceae bacterium]